MTKTGAVPSLLFTFFMLATFASGSVAMAEAPAPKAAAPAAATAPKPFVPGGAAPAAAPAKLGAPAAAAAKPAAPAAPAAPTMPMPSRELAAFMKGFEGSWKCDTKFAAGSTGPGSPDASGKATMKIRKEFDGFSWHGEYQLAKSNVMPAMIGVFQISYDPSGKQATYLSYDSLGAAMMGAGPLAGDSVTFSEEGFMLGMRVKVRETMTRKGTKEIHHKVEVDQGKGLQPMAEDTCKR